MAVLTEISMRPHRTIQEFDEQPLPAGEKIYRGAIVCRNPTTGYAVNGADTAGYEVLGVASKTADNTNGINGEINVINFVDQVHEFATSGADQTWTNKQVFVVDNDTVAMSGTTNNILLGTVVRVKSATLIEVHVPGITDNQKNSNAASTFDLSLMDWQSHTFDVLTAAEVDGTFNRALSSNALTLEANESVSETETDAMHYRLILPSNYQAGGAITVRFRAYIKGAGTVGATKTIDMEAFKQTDGTAGADICATAAQDLTAAYANYDFTITPTGLVPKDVIILKTTTAIQETAGTAIQSDIAKAWLICPTI